MIETYSNTSYRALFFDEEYEYNEYMKNITQQIKENPTTHLLNNLGVAYSELGDLKNAKQSLKEAIKLDTSNLNAHLNLIEVYNDEGNNKQVEMEFEKLLNSQFDRNNVLFNKALFHSMNNEYSIAIEIYNELINQSPTIQYLKNRARLFKQIGEHEKAKKDWISIDQLKDKNS